MDDFEAIFEARVRFHAPGLPRWEAEKYAMRDVSLMGFIAMEKERRRDGWEAEVAKHEAEMATPGVDRKRAQEEKEAKALAETLRARADNPDWEAKNRARLVADMADYLADHRANMRGRIRT